MSQLWQPGALEFARRIRRGEVTGQAAMEAHRARVDAVNSGCLAIADQIEQAVGNVTPIETVVA